MSCALLDQWIACHFDTALLYKKFMLICDYQEDGDYDDDDEVVPLQAVTT